MEQPKQFLTLCDLCERYVVKESTVYDWIARLGLPKPLKFGRLSRWKLSDILIWEDLQPQRVDEAPESRIAAVRGMQQKQKAIQKKQIKK